MEITSENIMNDQNNTCESYSQAISCLAAGELSSEETRELNEHLETCPACQEKYQQEVSLCQHLNHAKPANAFDPTNVLSNVMSQIESENDSFKLQTPDSQSRWKLYTSAAIAASLLLLISWLVFFSPNTQNKEYVKPSPPEIPNKSDTKLVQNTTAKKPTWLALQRAFQKSDEAFDSMLTPLPVKQTTNTPTTPFNSRDMLKEL